MLKREDETNENRRNKRKKVLLSLVSSIFVCFVFSFKIPHQAQPQNPRWLETVTRRLTSPEFSGRSFRSEGGYKSAQYIAGLYREIGLKPTVQQIAGGGQNVAALIEGNGAALKNEHIIIGAHYDAFGAPFLGAIDNAAGVATMLKIASVIAKGRPQRGVLFIAFDGGEQNHAGAKFYADHPLAPLEKAEAAIILSGFGGIASEQLNDTLFVIGAESSPPARQAASKHKRDESRLAVVGSDVMRWPGGEHFGFKFKQLPAITVTNGAHYSYHSKADIPERVNYAALEKHASTLAKVILEIANSPQPIDGQPHPIYDAGESMEWHRVLTAMRENVLKTPDNIPGQARIDDIMVELKRHEGRPVQDSKAREAVILPAANVYFYIANPNGVEYTSLLTTAQNHEQRGERRLAIDAYRKLLKFIQEEYRRDDLTINEIRGRSEKLSR